MRRPAVGGGEHAPRRIIAEVRQVAQHTAQRADRRHGERAVQAFRVRKQTTARTLEQGQSAACAAQETRVRPARRIPVAQADRGGLGFLATLVRAEPVRPVEHGAVARAQASCGQQPGTLVRAGHILPTGRDGGQGAGHVLPDHELGVQCFDRIPLIAPQAASRAGLHARPQPGQRHALAGRAARDHIHSASLGDIRPRNVTQLDRVRVAVPLDRLRAGFDVGDGDRAYGMFQGFGHAHVQTAVSGEQTQQRQRPAHARSCAVRNTIEPSGRCV